MVKTKGGGEQLKDDDNHALRCKGPPQNHSRPRCRFPRYSRSNFPGPRRKGVLMDTFYNHPEYIPILDYKNAIESSRQYADAALSYLREQIGGVVGGGARYHHNFTAKRAGDPHAPTKTFFSQIAGLILTSLLGRWIKIVMQVDEIIVAAYFAPTISITLQKVVQGYKWARETP